MGKGGDKVTGRSQTDAKEQGHSAADQLFTGFEQGEKRRGGGQARVLLFTLFTDREVEQERRSGQR